MKLIYKAKWIIVVMAAIMWLLAFVVLFVGGTAKVNRLLLGANVLLIIAQAVNVFVTFRNKHKDVGVALLGCLLIYFVLMWMTYIWSWNYTVKAITIGFE